MKVNLVRNIDYWLGIPICFILSIFYRLEKLINPGILKDFSPKKIMFLELSEMGSAILGYSAMKKVKDMYPGAELYFWIFKKNEDSVHILDLIPEDNVVTMRDDNILFLFLDTLRNLRRIRRINLDIIIDMELFSRFSSILSYLSRAKVRAGFHGFDLEGLYRGDLHTHKVSYNPYIHISKNFLSLVYSLKVCPERGPLVRESLEHCPTTVPQIKSSQQDSENLWAKLNEINDQISAANKIVILNPGINDILPIRRWPIDNYVGLAKELLKSEDTFIVLTGLKSQFKDAQFVLEAISSKRCINFAGKTTVRELINLFNISSLFISHDCGAVNLASLTQIPMIILFGPETPLLYSPLASNKRIFYKKFSCSPCLTAYNHRKSLCKDNRCMQAITVDEVWGAVREYLNSERNYLCKSNKKIISSLAAP